MCVRVHLLHHYAWTLVDIYIYTFYFFDNIFHLDVHYVCLLVQRFEPQGRRFTNCHYYYFKEIRPRHSGSVLQYFRFHQQMFCVLFYFQYATNTLYLCVCALHMCVACVWCVLHVCGVCCMCVLCVACVLCACGCECLSVSIAVLCKLWFWSDITYLTDLGDNTENYPNT